MSNTAVYFKHGLGNLIMMTPAIQALASMDNTGKVDIIMSSEWNDARRPAYNNFFTNWNVVNRVINYPKDKIGKYKRWFATKHSEHSAAMDIFKTNMKTIPNAANWLREPLHEVDYYMRFVRKMGYEGETPWQDVPVADKPILKHGLNVGLCNGCYSEKMKGAKQYPHFNKLSKTLKGLFGARIIKLGYQKELSRVECDINYVDKLNFTETAKVISQLDLLITTDTALMHAGDALKIPMIVLFGGSLASKNAPINPHAYIVKRGMSCQPCQKKPGFYNCPNYDCMQKLEVGDIIHVVKKAIYK